MAASLDITGAVQTAIKAWLTAAAFDWSPRILTGYQRQTAGDALGTMESGGEPDTIIVECATASPVYNTLPIHDAEVSIRIRHDPDRLEDPLADHAARVKALTDVLFGTTATEDLSGDEFTAHTINPAGQRQTSSGRSLETTIDLRLRCCAAEVA